MPKEKKLEKLVDNYVGILRSIDGMITHQAGWISHKEMDRALKIGIRAHQFHYKNLFHVDTPGVKGLELTNSTIRTYSMLIHQALRKNSFLQEAKSIKEGRNKIFRLTLGAAALGDALAPKVSKSAYNIQNARRKKSRNGNNGSSDQVKTDFEDQNTSEKADMIIKVYLVQCRGGTMVTCKSTRFLT